MGHHHPACGLWALGAPGAGFSSPGRTLGVLGVQPLQRGASSRGARVDVSLGNAFVRGSGGHLPGLSVGRVGRFKAWSARTTMSVIAPESGRMLFCALTACAAVGQVSSY